MPAIRQTLTVLKRIAIVIGIAIAFTLGLLGAIYLSLRSSETKVPDIVGKDRNSAETTISNAGLNFRVRATRASSEAKPDTVLIQLPRAGETVKVGQTVAVDISRPTKEGEASTSAAPSNENTKPENTSSAASNNANANASANANKKKPANRNDNSNANSNRPANRNRNSNANTNANATQNRNANATGTPVHTNSNSTATPPRTNSNRPVNANVNRRPVVAPTP